MEEAWPKSITPGVDERTRRLRGRYRDRETESFWRESSRSSLLPELLNGSSADARGAAVIWASGVRPPYGSKSYRPDTRVALLFPESAERKRRISLDRDFSFFIYIFFSFLFRGSVRLTRRNVLSNKLS